MNRLLLTPMVVLAMATGANAAPATLQGVWGGQQMMVTFDASGGHIQSSCGAGAISHVPHLDSKGRFRATGTFENDSPGPQRADPAPKAARAIFEGAVGGDTLRLTIRRGPGAAPETYQLARGVRPKLIRCL